MDQYGNLKEEEDRMCKAILEKYSFYNVKSFYDYDKCDESEINKLNEYFHEDFKFWDLESSGNEAALPTFVVDQNIPKQNFEPVSITYPTIEFQDKEILDFNYFKMKREKYLVLDSRENIKFQKPRKPLTMNQISQINEKGSFIAYIEPNLYQEWQVRKSIYYGKKRCYEKIKIELHNIKYNLQRIKEKFWIEGDFKSIISSKKFREYTGLDMKEDFSNLTIVDGLRHIFHGSIQLIELFIGFPVFEYNLNQIRKEKERVFQQRIEQKVKQNPDKYIELHFINRLLKDPTIFTSSTISFNEVKEVLNVISQVEDGQFKLSNTLFNSSEVQDKLLQKLSEKVTSFLLEKDFTQAEIESLLNHVKGDYLISKYVYDSKQYKTEKASTGALLQALKKHKLQKQYELVKLISHETLSGLSIFEKNKIYSDNKIYAPKLNSFCVSDVSRDSYFWKFRVYFYECNQVVSSCFSSLFKYLFKSPYGLKNILCWGDGYVPRESNNISQQVAQNYKSFEEEGDGGFFSNRYGKIVLFLHNRVINQFIYQFLMLNIFLRVMYFFCSCLLLFFLPFALFSWVLCLPYALLKILFVIFIYDGSVPKHNDSYPMVLPIFQVFFRIMFRGMLQIMVCPFLMFYYLIVIMINVFICLLIIPRRILDYMTFCVLTCNGRVPRKDSYSAKKIREKIVVFKGEEDQLLQQQRQEMNEGQEKLEKGYQYSFEQIKQMIEYKVERILTKYYINFQKNKVDQLYKDNNLKLEGILENSPFNMENNKITAQMGKLREAVTANLDYTYKEKVKKNLSKIPKYNGKRFVYPFSEALALFLQVQYYLSEKFSPSSSYTWILWQKYKLQQYDYLGLAEKLLSKIFGPSEYSTVFANILMDDKNVSKYDQNLIMQINKYFKEKYHFTYFFNNYKPFSFSHCLQRIFNKQASNQGLLSYEPRDWLLTKVSRLQE